MTEKYSKDELNAPEWLNKEFLEKALTFYEKEKCVKVNNFKISPGTSPGEHFASIMFKIDVSYECEGNNEHLFLMLKTIPQEEGVKMEFLKDSMAFYTEIAVYWEIIPKMEYNLRQKGDDTVFAPKLIYQSNDPVPLIILQDMNPEGFRTYENPVEFESSKILAGKLGKFHACSMHLHQQRLEAIRNNIPSFLWDLNENGADIGKMIHSYFVPHPEKPDYAEEWLVPGLKLAIEEVQKWEGCERIVEKLEHCLVSFGQKMTNIFLEKEGQAYKVLNHGDFHFKNLLQRHGGLEDKDVLMIDFQFSIYNTPVIDFTSMLYEIVSKDVRINHRDELITYYFDKFVSTLHLLEYKGKIPEFQDFQEEMDRCAYLEFGLFVCYGPFHFVDWSEIDFMDNMEKKDYYGDVIPVWQTNQEWRQYFIRTINEMINKGMLD